MEKKEICGDKEYLPEVDLISKILVWLPVVSLLRFKSVSKSWYALIESSPFIDFHATTTTTFNSSSSEFGSFVLHAAVKFQTFRENALFMLSSVSESACWCSESFGFNGSICGWCVSGYKSGSVGYWWRTNDDDQQLVLKLDNLGFPSCYNFGKIRPIDIVGSCNGLICLHDSEHSDDVSLWNPATRQFRILPKSSITINDDDGDDCLPRLFAFGFDAETNDYKVVLLSGLRLRRRIIDGVVSVVGPMECLCRVQVYSLSTDSWSRPLKGINVLPGSPLPYPDSSSSRGLLYLNGSCFFMAKFLYSERCIPPKNNDRFIISFDLTKEIIIPIQLPNHDRDQELYLCYLDKKIALFTTTKLYVGGWWERFHIWVLKEHCSSSSSVNNESWTVLHSFRIKHGLPGEWIIPRGISNDGVFALLETGLGKKKKKMMLYNLDTEEMKKSFICCDQVLSKAYAYKPSLVSIIGGNGYRISYADMVIGKASAEMDWKCSSRISQPMMIG